MYMYMLVVFVCMPVHVYGQPDRWWTATVMDFNAYWAALPILVGGIEGSGRRSITRVKRFLRKNQVSRVGEKSTQTR